MPIRILFSAFIILFLMQLRMSAQSADSLFQLSAIIYDDVYTPVPATHVINMNTHAGDVTDSLGIFRLPVHKYDTLLIRNIVFWDTLLTVNTLQSAGYVMLRKRRYLLEEAKIFEWGATYGDFREAFIEMPVQQTLGASLGLPSQDPEKVPLEMDEKAVKSAGLLFTSPVSFFYYNFNKHAISARKVYWLKKNQEKSDQFEALLSAENLAEITGLTGEELDRFQIFLAQRMVCDLNCSELDVYKEIYGLWEVYQELKERGML
jgi:hypothetical protein